MAGDVDSNSEEQDDARRLSSTMRILGILKLILAALAVLLAFTGFNTAKSVNSWLLLAGLNLYLLGRSCRSAGIAFHRASGAPISPLLGEALQRTNKLFGYYFVLVCIAVAVVGLNAAGFFVKIYKLYSAF